MSKISHEDIANETKARLNVLAGKTPWGEAKNSAEHGSGEKYTNFHQNMNYPAALALALSLVGVIGTSGVATTWPVITFCFIAHLRMSTDVYRRYLYSRNGGKLKVNLTKGKILENLKELDQGDDYWAKRKNLFATYLLPKFLRKQNESKRVTVSAPLPS